MYINGRIYGRTNICKNVYGAKTAILVGKAVYMHNKIMLSPVNPDLTLLI